jgi:uncharacterized protein YndB with AHSA1/START domain/predicted GNAT family acetyltransferase
VITYEWRGPFDNAAVNGLHAEGFGHRVLDDDWWAQVNQHSLGWVCALQGRDLVGFLNVAWDGGVHAFVLDTLVTAGARGQGVGTRLVAVAVEQARAARCEWLHVDFEDHLRPFYFGSCIRQWRVPAGMTSHVHEFEAREGGSFRISLSYQDPGRTGKSAAHTDTYHGHFARLVPDQQVVEVLEFETDDPALRGTMTVTTTLTDAAGGTDILVVYDGIPDAVPAADNETGTRMSLANLAKLVE